MLFHHIRNYGCRLNINYSYKGLKVAVMENEFLRISILIDKGSDIFEFLYKPKDIDFMYLSPWGIKSPSKFIPTIPSEDGNFLDFYEGGWQEIIPNFGYGVKYKGVEEGLHGESCLIPWDYSILEDSPEVISIKFMVRTYRTPFYLEKILTLKKDDPKLYISEVLKNEGYMDIDCMWTHHPTFGPPFLGNNTRISIPENKVIFILKPENEGKYDYIAGKSTRWPKIKGYSGKVIDFSYPPSEEDDNQIIDEICLGELKDSWYAVTNLDKKVGFAMRWQKDIFPYLWIWRMYGKGSKLPLWWGRFNCMAIELCSSYSPIGLNEAVKNKTALRLKPQQEIKTDFFAGAFQKDEMVKSVDEDGNIT